MLATLTRRSVVQGGLSVLVTALACAWSSVPCRVSVKGQSMAPTLLPGDHLLVAPARRLRRGDLVVVHDPKAAGHWVVKRVAALPRQAVRVGGLTLTAGERSIVVLGDNAHSSTDSRDYGPVAIDRVHGRVWYRYAPASRAGLLRAPGQRVT